jgi:hypothetical protein
MLMFLGMTVGGYGGWWLGDYLNSGLLATFTISTVGSVVGVYVVWRIVRAFMS